MLYVFPKDYRSKLASKSFRLKFEPWVDKAKVYIDPLMLHSHFFVRLGILENKNANITS